MMLDSFKHSKLWQCTSVFSVSFTVSVECVLLTVLQPCVTSAFMNEMPIAFNLNHIFVYFLAEILRNVASNLVPNLTVFGQCFTVISSNEVNGAVFAYPVVLVWIGINACWHFSIICLCWIKTSAILWWWHCWEIGMLYWQASIMTVLPTGHPVCHGTGIQWVLVRSVTLLVSYNALISCYAVSWISYVNAR